MLKVHVIDTGFFKLDGGAMFGIVPKSIWNKLNPADENNLCTWAMRCLLIEEGNRKILIDTGIGNKQSDKFFSYFEPHGDASLLTSVEQFFRPEDITDVIITHLHFDHVGGAVSLDKKGNLIPTFPNATYWTNEKHYDWAFNPNAREQASFLRENFVPLKDAGVLKMIDVEDDVPFSEHINIRFYNGHTEAMMVPFIDLKNGHKLVYTADLLPSSAHIKMPYVMAYDIRPMVTIKEKEEFYEMVTDGNHTVIFEHDRNYECGRIIRDQKGRYSADQLSTLKQSLSL